MTMSDRTRRLLIAFGILIGTILVWDYARSDEYNGESPLPISASFETKNLSQNFAGPVRRSGTEVILYRGLWGTIFSKGVDDIAEKIRKRCGIDVSVGSWFGSLRPLTANRVVLGGHSLGADRAVREAANYGGRVDVLLTYDPTSLVGSRPANVHSGWNWYQTEGLGGGQVKGSNNVDITGVGHTGVPYDARVQRQSVALACAR